MRFACFLTGDASPYTYKRYGDYSTMFRALLAQDGDVWDTFDVRLDQFPDDIRAYDALIVTGSASDAHSDDPWITKLNAKISEAYAAERKIFGFCFGHQAVANALGGRSGRNPAGWEAGLYDLELSDAWRTHPHTRDIDQLKVLEIHQDHVIDPPEGAQVLASTPKTPVQIFAIGDQVFGVQGHPEFHNDVIDDLVRTRAARGVFPQALADEAIEGMNTTQDSDQFVKIVNRFLGR